MKRVSVFGRYNGKLERIRRLLRKEGFLITNRDPDIVISVGGDGTYLMCERKFPGICKLMVRDSRICFHCEEHNYDDIENAIRKLKKRMYKVEGNMKLEASARGRKLIATNDIIIRNRDPGEAIRFSIKVNGKALCSEIIGDGVVIATPFGSTGYFNSITRRSFKKGIGIAFNNASVNVKHPVVKENSKIEVRILRGNAVLAADNSKELITLKKGNIAIVRKSVHGAKLLKLR